MIEMEVRPTNKHDLTVVVTHFSENVPPASPWGNYCERNPEASKN